MKDILQSTHENVIFDELREWATDLSQAGEECFIISACVTEGKTELTGSEAGMDFVRKSFPIIKSDFMRFTLSNVDNVPAVVRPEPVEEPDTRRKLIKSLMLHLLTELNQNRHEWFMVTSERNTKTGSELGYSYIQSNFPTAQSIFALYLSGHTRHAEGTETGPPSVNNSGNETPVTSNVKSSKSLSSGISRYPQGALVDSGKVRTLREGEPISSSTTIYRRINTSKLDQQLTVVPKKGSCPSQTHVDNMNHSDESLTHLITTSKHKTGSDSVSIGSVRSAGVSLLSKNKAQVQDTTCKQESNADNQSYVAANPHINAHTLTPATVKQETQEMRKRSLNSDQISTVCNDEPPSKTYPLLVGTQTGTSDKIASNNTDHKLSKYDMLRDVLSTMRREIKAPNKSTESNVDESKVHPDIGRTTNTGNDFMSFAGNIKDTNLTVRNVQPESNGNISDTSSFNGLYHVGDPDSEDELPDICSFFGANNKVFQKQTKEDSDISLNNEFRSDSLEQSGTKRKSNEESGTSQSKVQKICAERGPLLSNDKMSGVKHRSSVNKDQIPSAGHGPSVSKPKNQSVKHRPLGKNAETPSFENGHPVSQTKSTFEKGSLIGKAHIPGFEHGPSVSKAQSSINKQGTSASKAQLSSLKEGLRAADIVGKYTVEHRPAASRVHQKSRNELGHTICNIPKSSVETNIFNTPRPSSLTSALATSIAGPRVAPFLCLANGCGKSFKERNQLRLHYLTHSEKHYYLCPVCKSEFKTRKTASKHCKTTHPEMTDLRPIGPTKQEIDALERELIGKGWSDGDTDMTLTPHIHEPHRGQNSLMNQDLDQIGQANYSDEEIC